MYVHVSGFVVFVLLFCKNGSMGGPMGVHAMITVIIVNNHPLFEKCMHYVRYSSMKRCPIELISM